MKVVVLCFAMALVLAGAPARAGNCDYSWQTASDGSSCGDRAADRRDGGN